MAGLYIHIPFCTSRCIYCDFYSTTGRIALQDRYVEALAKEYDMRREYLTGEPVTTIYIGGGTPSTLSTDNLMSMADMLPTGKDMREFTMECNPDDITDELCQTIKAMGVNRVSLGVQTFSEERLRFLNRRHSAGQIAPAIALLKDHGISNISIDLMFGFPGETMAQWERDIELAQSLDVQHISAYSLMYEQGTTLTRMLELGKIKESPEEVSAEMYEVLVNRMQKAGYRRYEISNFAKDGYESMHNSSYWNDTKYLGLGAAAHSYNRKSRQWNVSELNEYIEGIEAGEVPCDIEPIDRRTHYNDLVTTALRTVTGLNLNLLQQEEREYALKSGARSIANGLLQQTEDAHLCLTDNGFYVSDDVMSDLIWI